MYVRRNPVDDTGGVSRARTHPPHTHSSEAVFAKKNQKPKKIWIFSHQPSPTRVSSHRERGGGGDRTHEERWLCLPVAREYVHDGVAITFCPFDRGRVVCLDCVKRVEEKTAPEDLTSPQPLRTMSMRADHLEAWGKREHLPPKKVSILSVH